MPGEEKPKSRRGFASMDPDKLREVARKLDALVARCIAEAPAKDDPAAFLMNNAERLDGWISDMARDVFHKHLHGVTAFDLANARDELACAAPVMERRGRPRSA